MLSPWSIDAVVSCSWMSRSTVDAGGDTTGHDGDHGDGAQAGDSGLLDRCTEGDEEGDGQDECSPGRQMR